MKTDLVSALGLYTFTLCGIYESLFHRSDVCATDLIILCARRTDYIIPIGICPKHNPFTGQLKFMFRG